jgi:hypothetical protein
MADHRGQAGMEGSDTLALRGHPGWRALSDMRRSRRVAWGGQRDDAFARIVASLGDPEWRRERSAVLAVSVAVVMAAIAIFVMFSFTRPDVLVGFLVAFVVGITFDMVILRRRYRPPR